MKLFRIELNWRFSKTGNQAFVKAENAKSAITKLVGELKCETKDIRSIDLVVENSVFLNTGINTRLYSCNAPDCDTNMIFADDLMTAVENTDCTNIVLTSDKVIVIQ